MPQLEPFLQISLIIWRLRITEHGHLVTSGTVHLLHCGLLKMLASKSRSCLKLQKCTFFSACLILFIPKKNPFIFTGVSTAPGLDSLDDSGCLASSNYACVAGFVCLDKLVPDLLSFSSPYRQSEPRLTVKTMWVQLPGFRGYACISK